MSSFERYAMPTDSHWKIPGAFETHFDWEYDEGRAALLALYRKGKRLQWDAEERIDWSQDLDPENPEEMPDEFIPIFGWEGFSRLSKREVAQVRRHFQAWQISQFLHGEQGALICTASTGALCPAKRSSRCVTCSCCRNRFLASIWMHTHTSRPDCSARHASAPPSSTKLAISTPARCRPAWRVFRS